MATHLNKLTALQVSKLSARGLYGDGGGLTLQITKAGGKSWLFRYMRDGRARAMGLGATHIVNLADARKKAIDARKLLDEGLDPLDVKNQKRLDLKLAQAKLMTFDQCAAAYIDAHKASWKNSKHASQWTNTISAYASPIFGQQSVANVDTALIVKCLAPIWQNKTETASRLRGRIESVLGWATTSEYRTGENPARWKGHLENLLPSVSKSARVQNHPSLQWQQIGDFMDALKMCRGVSARALEFLILTASRSGEVRGAPWSEFDLSGGVWTIPPERMKSGREHKVPLSVAAIAVLNSVRNEALNGLDADLTRIDRKLAFPGRNGSPLSDMSLLTVIRRMNAIADKPIWTDVNGVAVTVHGFRSTFRMWAAEKTDFPREVAEHALAHLLPDAVERAYQRGTIFIKREKMMSDWAKFCGAVSSAK